ncbi:MAG: zinc ABC transporter substrate-binding protein [Thermoleophilia bacterium]|nr:zinc ABC transporter substrate-binding protein [Thermoleophilia bacterium]
MIADLVREVGGTRVSVTGLMGPGVDPHLYKASEGDVTTLASADVVFYNGLHLEAKMADVLERIQGRISTSAVTDGIPRAGLLAPPQFAGQYDPHVWFDVTFWMRAAETVRDTLVRLDPTHAETYRRNAARYLRRLRALDAEIRRLVARIPPDRRVLVTAHDAFGYFGRAYGFQVLGLQGISTAAEAGTADVQRLADLIAQREIPAIFVESSVPQQTIKAVQEAVRSRGFDVEIGGQLFSDAMGDAGTPEGTYIGMVLSNVRTIVEGLTR